MSREDYVMPEHRSDQNVPTGVIDLIEGDTAVVLVGVELEPWHFPMGTIPDGASEGSVLELRRRDRTFDVVSLDPVAEIVKGRPFPERLRRARRKERFAYVTKQLQMI